jgi:hypothetical protein
LLLDNTRPDLNIEQKLSMVEKMIKSTYPTRFENKKQFEPGNVESGEKNISVKLKSDKKISMKDLPSDLQRIGRQLSPSAQEQYIKDCQAAGLI